MRAIRSPVAGVLKGHGTGHTSTFTLTFAFASTFRGMYIQQIGSDCLSMTERVLLVVQGQGILRCLLSFWPICALYLRMLKHIGCSLSLKIRCGDTLARPDN